MHLKQQMLLYYSRSSEEVLEVGSNYGSLKSEADREIDVNDEQALCVVTCLSIFPSINYDEALCNLRRS